MLMLPTRSGVAFATSYAGLLERHRDKMKPEVVWNIEKGLSYSIADLVRAENDRAAMLRQMNLFFDSYDLLLCPATIVAAYPVGERYVKECAGHTFTNYVEWLAILERPIPDVQVILTQETDDGQRLRQNSPFIRILPDDELKAIRAMVLNDQRAA